VREINVSRAGDPVHAGDKALTWETPAQRHLGWRFGSLDIILKVDHLRTLHAMFALN
jgi:hypothetical protein